MNFIVIIPARYFSTRLPGKVLADINGKPMIIHVIDHARKSGADRVIVATDHKKVASVVESIEGEVCMTNPAHGSGTERLAEVIEKYGFSDDTIIVNLQVDEPAISAMIIRHIVNNLVQCKAEMVTLASPISKLEDVFNPNVVKVILDINSYALYFFRTTFRNCDFFKECNDVVNSVILHHLGIYGYRAGFVRRYFSWQPSPLEKFEELEQLRVLWYGRKIYVVTMQESNISINTQEDLILFRTKLH